MGRNLGYRIRVKEKDIIKTFMNNNRHTHEDKAVKEEEVEVSLKEDGEKMKKSINPLPLRLLQEVQ